MYSLNSRTGRFRSCYKAGTLRVNSLETQDEKAVSEGPVDSAPGKLGTWSCGSDLDGDLACGSVRPLRPRQCRGRRSQTVVKNHL